MRQIMITDYVEEYIRFVEFLSGKGLDQVLKMDESYIWIEKELIIKLLGQNEYSVKTPADRLRIWRRLQWIKVEDGRLTSRMYVEPGKHKRVIQIRREPAACFQEIQNSIKNGGH